MKTKYGITLEALAAIYLLLLAPAFSISLEGSSFDMCQSDLVLQPYNLSHEDFSNMTLSEVLEMEGQVKMQELNNTNLPQDNDQGQQDMKAGEAATLAGIADNAGQNSFYWMSDALSLINDHMTKQEINDDALSALRNLRQKKMMALDAKPCDLPLGGNCAAYLLGHISSARNNSEENLDPGFE